MEWALLCLATTIYFEARGEPALGQIAVAQVVIERTISDDYPSTICEVVKQGRYDHNGNPLRNQCHFSYWCDGKKEIIDDESAAFKALLFGALAFIVPPLTDRAVCYHSVRVSPYWADKERVTRTLSNHVFQKTC